VGSSPSFFGGVRLLRALLPRALVGKAACSEFLKGFHFKAEASYTRAGELSRAAGGEALVLSSRSEVCRSLRKGSSLVV